MATEQKQTDPSDYDFAAYCSGTKEKKLRIISNAWKAATPHQRTFFEGMMFADSIGLEEHPDWFNHNCGCDTCMSYD